jgi:hypothetical protein
MEKKAEKTHRVQLEERQTAICLGLNAIRQFFLRGISFFRMIMSGESQK